MTFKKSVWIPTILCAAVAGTSSYITFGEDSPVERSYFINEYAVATADAHEEILQKDAVLASASVQTVTANATDIDELLVARGQVIAAGEELLKFRTEAAEREYERLQIQADAYKDELDALETIASSLGYSGSNDPTGNLTLSEIGDQLTVDLELEVSILESPLQAAAIIDQRIIEVQRELDIVDSYLAMANDGEAALISPIDGTITAIETSSGFMTIEIYSAEQEYVTFVSDSEWQRLAEGQAATISAPLEDDSLEGEITGTVSVKHKVPATNSPAYEQIQQIDVYKDRPLYEVAIQADEALDPLPFGAIAQAKIVLNEELFAYKLPTSWIAPPPKNLPAPAEGEEVVEGEEAVDVMLDDIQLDASFYGEDNVYTLGYDGRVRLNPIDVSFTTDNASITPTDLIDGTILLNATERDIYSETFLTMPTKKLQWNNLKQLSWEEYVKYLVF